MAWQLESGSAGRLRIAGWLVITLLAGMVAASTAKAETFTEPDPVTWSSLPSSNKPWDPYPSSLVVPATEGTVGSARIHFHGFHLGNLGYMHFMLVGPHGERAILASDMSYGAYNQGAIELVFADDGSTYPEGQSYPPAGTTFVMKPINANTGNDTIWTPPAPGAVGATSSLATAFNGINPTGTWDLYGMGTDSLLGQYQASIGSGWSLELEIVAPSPPPEPAPVPELSGLTVTPKSFRAANLGGSTLAISSRRKAPVGGTVLYRLSGDGAAYFRAERLVRGVRKKGRCAPIRGRGKKKRRACIRKVKVKGGFQLPGTIGLNAFLFTGRISGRALKPGRYRLIGRASADAEAFSKPARTAFRIRR